MNNLMIFENKQVEVFEWNGKVLFNPKHVSECLDIADVNSSIRNFNENQVVKLTNSDMHDMHSRKLNNAGEKFLTESGVYKLIFKSKKAEAERFQDWVTDEVLPQIRKTGSYQIPKMSKELQAIFMIDEKTEELKNELNAVKKDYEEFKDNMPLLGVDCEAIVKMVKSVATEALGGYNETPAYKDRSLNHKVYADIYSQLKREFQVTSYKSIKRCQLEQAKEIVKGYKLPTALADEIVQVNNQLSMI